MSAKIIYINSIDLIIIDDEYSIQYKLALNKAQTKNDYTELREIFIRCQQRLNLKLDFLRETITYMENIM